MDLNYVIERLAANAGIFEGLTKAINTELALWKPAPDKWSILEVVNHLFDEERQDFRQRLDLVLKTPEQTWPAIDPQNWVTSRRYNERDLDTSLKNFFDEREKSLSWLSQLV